MELPHLTLIGTTNVMEIKLIPPEHC